MLDRGGRPLRPRAVINMSATTTIADAYGEGACLYETGKGSYTVEREKKLYLE